MTALIFEPAITGHHLHFVRILTRGLLDLGVRVVLGLPEGAADAPEFAVHLADLADRVELSRPVVKPATPTTRAWRAVGEDLVRLTGELRPDRVFLPYTGGLPLALGLRWRPWPFPDVALEGLVMRGGWAYPSPSRKAAFRQRMLLHLLRRVPWDRLHLLDPLPYFWMQQRGKLDAQRHHLIPEPVEPIAEVSPTDARQRLGLPTDGRWAVVTGQQDSRKGIDRLLRAYAEADTPDDARLLLAGKASDEIRGWVNRDGQALVAQGKLHQIDRYLSEEEFDLALNAADTMVAPHFRPVGSSGLLVRAAALNKPVLATDYGWTGWATQTFGLGRTVDIEDPAAYAEALTALFRDPPAFGNGHTAGFVAYHTLDNHLAHWLAQTRAALGQPVDPGYRDWNELFPPNAFETAPR